MNNWYVYILQCADGSYYTGITIDLDARIQAHNHEKTGAKYTRARRPVSLVYTENHDTRSNAQKREIAIKRLTRAQKICLITTEAKEKKRQKTDCTMDEIEDGMKKQIEEFKKINAIEPDNLASGDMQKIIDGVDDDDE